MWRNLNLQKMDIGKNLIKLRNEKKVSQQKVAEYLGVGRSTYTGWEAKGNFKSDDLQKLADYFEVDISELFKEDVLQIVINQNSTDNKDNSVNGIVILLNDKKVFDEILKTIRGQVK